MSACEKYEGLIAAALYETLDDADKAELSAHLTDCADCRAESRSLSALREFIPVETVTFQGNLRPVLEERVRDSTTRGWIPRFVFSGFCGVLVVAALSFVLMRSSSDTPGESPIARSASEIYFASVVARVERMVDEEKYPQAYITLRESIENAKRDTVPSEARVLLAEIAYERLQWFPEAHAAYDQLRLADPSVYQESDVAIRRYALLDEARVLDSEYASLHRWNRVIREEDIGELRGYIEQYPGTFQASDAVQEMARLIARDSDADDVSLDSVLASALASDESPIVVAQIKLELGRYYWRTGDDRVKARELFEDIESSSVTVLARAASESLLALGGE